MRSGCQFHWMNRGYRDFRDYLDALTSKRRKEIRRERRDAAAAPVEIEILDGRAATEAHWSAYHALYSATYDRKWGLPRADPSVLHRGGAALPDRTLLVLARRGRSYVARRPLLRGPRHPLRPQLGLHRAAPRPALRDLLLPPDRALHPARARPLRRRRPGRTQAPAGLLPVETHSAHWIADPAIPREVNRPLPRGESASSSGATGRRWGSTPPIARRAG